MTSAKTFYTYTGSIISAIVCLAFMSVTIYLFVIRRYDTAAAMLTNTIQFFLIVFITRSRQKLINNKKFSTKDIEDIVIDTVSKVNTKRDKLILEKLEDNT
jgi:hypothetical protein